MKPYYTLPIVIAIVVPATAGLGLALARVHQRTVPPAAVQPPAPPKQVDPSPTESLEPSISPSPIAAPSATALRRPVQLFDAAVPGTAFYDFREQLRQAVRSRNAEFVESLIPDTGVSIGYSAPSTVAEMDLANPAADLWAILEKSLALGCDELSAEGYAVDPGTSLWQCPNVARAFLDQYPNPNPEPGIEYEMSYAVIVGDRINVRSLPSLDAAVIGTLSNEAVVFDQQSWERYASSIPAESWAAMTHPLHGWTPIVMPDGQRGYVNNRYVYQPLAPHVLLGQVDGQWQILHIPSGD